MDDNEPTEPEDKPKAPASQHIFQKDKLEEIAIEWKKMVAEGKRNEAMPLLEDLIKGCQQMLPRLAQYEGFTVTVDVETLIAGASSKIEGWLMAWKPDFKHASGAKAANGLFSFLSKCLSGDTRITYADGSTHRIDEIVENELTPEVLAYDESGEIVTARVIGWHKNAATKEEWRKLQVMGQSRRGKCLYVTGEHPMWTQAGWTAVDDLKPTDTLYLGVPQFTDAGWSAFIGMYLGDGHLRKDGNLVVGHGEKQREYVEHLAEKFNQTQYHHLIPHNFGEGTRDDTRTYAASSVVISFKERVDQDRWSRLVSGVTGFSLKEIKAADWTKKVTPYVISQLNPIALAYWYMDDGSSGRSAKNTDKEVENVGIHTESFTRAECQLLQDWLETIGVKTTWQERNYGVYAGKGYGKLHVCKQSWHAFFSLIAPHVIPSLRYKLPEEYRYVPYVDVPFVEHRPVAATSWKVRPVKGYANNHRVNRDDGPPDRIRYDKNGIPWFTPDWQWKYNIAVDGPNTYIAEGIIAHNCAKNAFRSELSKVNQYRRHYHASGENLEKFFGEVDYNKYREEVTEEVHNNLKDLAVRWGAPQEIGCVRFIVESVTEEKREDEKKESATDTRERVIRSAAYAWCVSPDLAKFFYSWAMYALRDSMYSKAYIPFKQEDVLRHAESYTHLVDLLDIIGWEKFKHVIATLGGTRLKLPTLQQMAKHHDQYRMMLEINNELGDPDSVEKVGKKYGKSQKTAQQVYAEMSELMDHKRCGEHSLFGDADEHGME